MRKDLVVLGFLATALFGWRLGSQDFWEPDEPDFALISREMLASGDWVVPTRNGVPYAEKPPLACWMVSGLGRLTGTGVNGWTGRLPSACCGALAVLAVYLAGCRWLSRETGIRASLILMTMPLWLVKARWLLTDMPLAGFLAVAVLGMARGVLDREPPPLWAFAALALAWLSKGPLAGALCFVAIVGTGFLLQRNPFPHLGRWMLGGLVFLLIVAPWYLLVRQRAPAVFEEVLWSQNARFLETASHARPVHYYLLPILYNLLPWTPAVLAGAWLGGRGRRERPVLGLLLAWLLGGLLLLSAAKVKQEKYLLPLLPAAALLGAWALESESLRRWTFRLGVWILLLLAGIFAVAAWHLDPVLWGMALAAALCGMAVSAFPSVPCLAAAFLVFYLSAFSLVLPLADRQKSARPFTLEAVRLAGSGPLAFYGGDLQAAYPYYAGRRVDYVSDEEAEEGLARYLATHPGALLLIRRKELDRLPEPLKGSLRVCLRETAGNNAMAAVRRTP